MRRLLALIALSAAVPAVALADGGAKNLIATPAVKAALRASFLKTHPDLAPAKVAGPIKGRTYYGSYHGKEYALATFSIPRFGTQDQPEIFTRPSGRAWKDLGDTGGDVCVPWVPLTLIKVWQLKSSGNAGCYYEP